MGESGCMWRIIQDVFDAVDELCLKTSVDGCRGRVTLSEDDSRVWESQRTG